MGGIADVRGGRIYATTASALRAPLLSRRHCAKIRLCAPSVRTAACLCLSIISVAVVIVTSVEVAHNMYELSFNARTADLRWNNVGVAGGRALCDALRYNTTVTALELSGSDVMLETLQQIGTYFV